MKKKQNSEASTTQNIEWFNPQVIEEVHSILNMPLHKGVHKTAILGEEGLGKHDLVLYLSRQCGSRYLLIQHLNFSAEKFSSPKFLSDSIRFYLKNLPEFDSFLKSFKKDSLPFIKVRLEEFTRKVITELDWYFEIFLQFLRYVSEEKIILLFLENLDQLDGYQFERVDSFFSQLKELPVHVIGTYNPEGTFKHSLKDFHPISLSKLSIQSVERSIQSYFSTSTINARLMTNHCFLKSKGNSLKIRYLLFSLYWSVLNKQGVLDIKKLQRLKLPESWQDFFPLLSSRLNKNESRFLIFLSYLNEPLCQKDIAKTLSIFKLKTQLIQEWIKGGLLIELIYQGEIYYNIRQVHFKKWLRNLCSLEELNVEILAFSRLMEQGSIREGYHVSELVYGSGERDMAFRLAPLEGDYHLELGDFHTAADRYYFALRIADDQESSGTISSDTLQKLGDIYLFLKSYENAFEIFKRLRSIYNPEKASTDKDRTRKWLEVNLKMAEALVEMDSFQEARYLIREIRVKKIANKEITARCLELLGDIETNVARVDQAQKNYEEAYQLFAETHNTVGLYSVYLKLKPHISKKPAHFIKIIQETLDKITAEGWDIENRGWLLRDRIQYFLKEKKYHQALQDCYELKKILRKIYQPRLAVQLAFYLGEIYSQLGKWQLAMSHLQKINRETYVIHRPELNVQTLIQLGMIFKEQARYGDARRILNSGMEICFRNGYHELMNEIKLHLGHIYLLVHSLLRANELLREVNDWAKRYQVSHIQFLSSLYLSYYELQQNRLEKSRQLLSEAKRVFNTTGMQVDLLNYLFYLCLWLVKAGRGGHGNQVSDLLLRKAQHYPRYQAAGYFLSGKVLLLLNEPKQSGKQFDKSLTIAQKWQFPQIQYLVLCDQTRQALRDAGEKNIKSSLRKICRFIEKMSLNIGDEILAVQFRESQFHEDILKYCRKYKLH